MNLKSDNNDVLTPSKIKIKLAHIQKTIDELTILSDHGITGFKEVQYILIDKYVKYSRCLDILNKN